MLGLREAPPALDGPALRWGPHLEHLKAAGGAARSDWTTKDCFFNHFRPFTSAPPCGTPLGRFWTSRSPLILRSTLAKVLSPGLWTRKHILRGHKTLQGRKHMGPVSNQSNSNALPLGGWRAGGVYAGACVWCAGGRRLSFLPSEPRFSHLQPEEEKYPPSSVMPA